MTTRLLIVSDTHLPTRARDLPDEVWAAVDEADVVVHAGDWADVALLDRLDARARRLAGCWGNVDGPALRARLPEVAHLAVDGVRLTVTHDSGPTQGRERRMDALFPDTDVLVFGHSHIPWDSVSPKGMRLLNPGSPTDRRRQPTHTYMTAVIDNGSLDVRLHHLEPSASR
ncbi:MAG: YfcE family phosphodiesterase [Actinomycetes bacterium]|nr:YfcE family phosphodiesterase [Actinomycetes bacterium]MDX5380642.1 YfcE family phosphodiesterase [Actinomycetes bacterium]MDX5399594.1 YfcE family phosphodiesterase [Actinomycetes bacterium]MDX5450384.1 YfcE family phosphodiesterase [Actinomycetes bacterium]